MAFNWSNMQFQYNDANSTPVLWIYMPLKLKRAFDNLTHTHILQSNSNVIFGAIQLQLQAWSSVHTMLAPCPFVCLIWCHFVHLWCCLASYSRPKFKLMKIISDIIVLNFFLICLNRKTAFVVDLSVIGFNPVKSLRFYSSIVYSSTWWLSSLRKFEPEIKQPYRFFVQFSTLIFCTFFF